MIMKLLVIFVFFLSYNLSTSQALEPSTQKTPQELYNFHIKKKKINKTIAWIALGVGSTSVLLNTLSNSVDVGNNNNSEWLNYVGGAVTFASIPLFLSASHHNNKAKFYLSQGAVGFNNKYKFSGLSISYAF